MPEGNEAEFLVDSRWLDGHRGDPSLVLIDTRPPAEYWAGHLEGARHFDPFPFHHSDTGEAGLKEFYGQLAWIFSALGITGQETALFYENESGMRSTRVAWMVELMGHPSVRILDGGIGSVARSRLVTTVTPVTPTSFAGTVREEKLASYKYVADRLGRSDVQIFDVRSDEEFFGERVRARRGGAVPGAFHRDWKFNLDSSGAFKAAAQLREEFERIGLRPECEIIPYCQGGYRSANAFYALRLAGYGKVRNYLGSWGEWGNREDLPIEKPMRRRAMAKPVARD